MKLRETISWLMGTLQRSLFTHFEECSGAPLTKKQKNLIQILEIVQVEKFVPKTADKQWMGRKLLDREAIARSFVAKMVYISHDMLFDNGITGNSQSAFDSWFCEKERHSFGGDFFPGVSGVFGQWVGGPGPSGVGGNESAIGVVGSYFSGLYGH